MEKGRIVNEGGTEELQDDALIRRYLAIWRVRPAVELG